MQALLTATFLLATLLGTADPPNVGTADPPDLLTPTAPPEPRPCTVPTPCDPAPPSATPDPAPKPPNTQGSRQSGQGTGRDVDAPVSPPGGDRTNWWLVAIPGVAFAVAGALLLIRRAGRRS